MGTPCDFLGRNTGLSRRLFGAWTRRNVLFRESISGPKLKTSLFLWELGFAVIQRRLKVSKNYYPEMVKCMNSGVSQGEIIRWMCAYRPHSIIQAVKAIQSAQEEVKTTVDTRPCDPEWLVECRSLVRNAKHLSAAKLIIENCGLSVRDGVAVAKRLIENVDLDVTKEPWWGTRRPIKPVKKTESQEGL
jgi:hypothetical protein